MLLLSVLTKESQVTSNVKCSVIQTDSPPGLADSTTESESQFWSQIFIDLLRLRFYTNILADHGLSICLLHIFGFIHLSVNIEYTVYYVG